MIQYSSPENTWSNKNNQYIKNTYYKKWKDHSQRNNSAGILNFFSDAGYFYETAIGNKDKSGGGKNRRQPLRGEGHKMLNVNSRKSTNYIEE